MPSTRGEETHTSRHGSGFGRPGTWAESILNASASSAAGAKALVRSVAPITAWNRPRIRSSSIDLISAKPAMIDRKSVVSGKRVSVRVDLGGRRIIKKKHTKKKRPDKYQT